MNKNKKGFFLAFFGVLCISPDALVIRLLSLDSYSLIFWRSLFSFFGFLLILYIAYGKNAFSLFRQLKKPQILLAIIQAFSAMSFVFSIQLTSVINTLIILALTPLSSAFISYIFYKRKIATHTIFCMIIAILATMFVVSDKFIDLSFQALPFGEIFAICAMLGISTSFSIANGNSTLNFLPSQCLSMLALSIIFLPFNNIWQPSFYELNLLIILGVFIQALALGLLLISSKYISSTESALMLLVETVLGPFWVWLFINEIPSQNAMLGGFIILSALLTNSIISIKKTKTKVIVN